MPGRKKMYSGPRELFAWLKSLITSFYEAVEHDHSKVRCIGEIRNLGGIKGIQMTYDVSIKTLPTVKSATRKSGSAHEDVPLLHNEGWEPLIDVFNEGTNSTVMVQLPGVEEDDIKIKLNVKNDTLTISLDEPHREYYTVVRLPTPIKAETVETAYKNGVLEVKLERTERVKA